MRKILLSALMVFLSFMFIPQAYLMSTTQKINTNGTIRYVQAQYEVELFRATDNEKLFSETGIEVLGVATSSIRYGVAIDAWQNGLWTAGVVADTSLSDRFFVECSEGVAVRLSTEEWVEWVSPMLDDLTYSDPSSDWAPSNAQLWFSTDFSTTQKIQQSDRAVLSDFPDMFCYPDAIVYNALGFDTNIFHSATRSFKITWGGDLPAEKPRPQIRIYDLPDEYWGSVWFYLPSNHKLKNWHLIMEPYTGGFINSVGEIRRNSPIYLQGSGGDGSGPISIRIVLQEYTDPDQDHGTQVFTSGNLNIIKRGEWINVKYHIRNTIDGVAEVWVESPSYGVTKISDYRGDLRSINYSNDDRTDIIISQWYCRVDEPQGVTYFDDFKVWVR